jgi:hypothetical protein
VLSGTGFHSVVLLALADGNQLQRPATAAICNCRDLQLPRSATAAICNCRDLQL